MSGVEFDVEQQEILKRMHALQQQGQAGSSSKFIQFLLNRNIVKTERGGKMVLAGIIIFNFLITIFFNYYGCGMIKWAYLYVC